MDGMDPNSYTNADATFGPPKTGPHWDADGEYEYADKVFELGVYAPPRPPPRFLPKFLTREPVTVSFTHIIRPPQDQPNYDCFDLDDLDDMKTKVVKVKAQYFPAELRCTHLGQGTGRKCLHGCYVLEKGGEVSRWQCNRNDCEGHVYVGKVKRDCDGIACFGKKGERLVCLA